MTTTSKAEQKRPHLAIEEENRQSENRPRRWRWYGRAGEYLIYFQSEADAIFESLETELAVTRRALELMARCNYHVSMDSAIKEFIEAARRERGR